MVINKTLFIMKLVESWIQTRFGNIYVSYLSVNFQYISIKITIKIEYEHILDIKFINVQKIN